MPLRESASSSGPAPVADGAAASSSAAVVDGVSVIVLVGDVPSVNVGRVVGVVSDSAGLSVDVEGSEVKRVVCSPRVGSAVGDVSSRVAVVVSGGLRIVVIGSWMSVSCPAEGVGCRVVVGRTVVVTVVCSLRGHSTSTRCPVTIMPSSESASMSSSAHAFSMRDAATSSPCTQLAEHSFPNTKSVTAQPDTGSEYARMHRDVTFSDVMIWKLVMESAAVVDGATIPTSISARHNGRR